MSEQESTSNSIQHEEVVETGNMRIDALRVGNQLYRFSSFKECVEFLKQNLRNFDVKYKSQTGGPIVQTPSQTELNRYRSVKNLLLAFAFMTLDRTQKLNLIRWSKSAKDILSIDRNARLSACDGINWSINTLKNCISYIPSKRFSFNCNLVKVLNIKLWAVNRSQGISETGDTEDMITDT